ncbi:MAG TPA: ATP-binding protein [Bryobacteraceae bacterium]|nr:ATP-binding protein [Bryobacteraceae bacterium]
MAQASKDDQAVARPPALRSLASKFSILTGALVFWMVATIVAYDLRQGSLDPGKWVLLCAIVLLVAAAISRFTIRLLARPLALLEEGIASVRKGRLEPIQVSKTGDELEFLGESFNQMIEALAASRKEVQDNQELLEKRIKERTDQLEEASRGAQAANDAKSDFLANVSHELRTPMNGIIGMLDLAMDHNLPADVSDQLTTAQRCAFSLLSLVNDLLDLSKIEAGKMTLEKVPVDIRTVLDECIQASRPKAVENSVELRAETASNVPGRISGDPLRIRQIIGNLVSNAVKFTEHGSVVVRLGGEFSDPRDFTVRVVVEDSGAGIPADKLLSIFEKFTQADGSVTRRYGGTGLGLAITRRLVELHRGDIQVKSELGRGTTFTVTLKSQAVGTEEQHASPQAVPEASVAAPPHPVRILVVEDNLVNQKVVTAVLRKRGFSIELANDGQEALAKLGRSPVFDLVLMDVQMPVLDGLEATRLIRKDQRWKKLPIIAMTAHAMNGDKERCLDAGMNGYISKPVHPSLLLSTVDEFLTQKAR